MNFKHSFSLETLHVEAYAMNFINGLPTKFQIFVNGGFEGFIFYGDDKWVVQKVAYTAGKLTDDLAQKTGERIMQIYQ